MHAIRFDKDYAARVLDALNTGKPIPAQPDGWTGLNMMTVVGILYATVYSQGPHKHQSLGISAEQIARLHSEQREAVEQAFELDLHNAIDFVSMLTFKVIGGEYDAACEPLVEAVVYQKEDGTKSFVPVSGFKQT